MVPMDIPMREVYIEFLNALDQEDKEKAVEMVLKLLEAGEIGIVQLYTEVLAPALNTWECNEQDDPTCIWKEHVRSQTVRTILEIAYPYVLKERRKRGIQDKGVEVAVLCPPEELHEIGPKMVADFFTLAGYDVTFVGANTPTETLIASVRSVRPRYVAVSVTNNYNLVALRKALERIKDELPDVTEIIVGGGAFNSNPGLAEEIGADRLLTTFEDIVALDGGD
jgi:methanogenic corrinoid protein MtbC1